MADRGLVPAAGRKDHGSGRDQQETATDDSSHLPKLLKADVHKSSDGFETFKYARASAPNVSDARAPPVQKQPESRQQKSTPRKQNLQRKSHGTAALLTTDNLTHLHKPLFSVPTASSTKSAILTEPHRSTPSPVEQSKHSQVVQGMTHLLSSIQEASEPPTSSPQQNDDDRSQNMHDGSSMPNPSAYLHGRSLLPQRDRFVPVQSSASHTSLNTLSAPVPSQFRRTTSILSEGIRSGASIRAMPTLNASSSPAPNIFRTENPFKRSSHSQQSRSNTPVPAAKLPSVPSERPASPLRTTIANLSGSKRSRMHMTSKPPPADSEDDYQFSDLEDFPIQSLQPSAKKPRIVQPETPLLTAVTPRALATSASRTQDAVDSSVGINKLAPDVPFQRPARPAGVYKDRRRDQRSSGVNARTPLQQSAILSASSPSAHRVIDKQIEDVNASSSTVVADHGYKTGKSDSLLSHVASRPSSSCQTSALLLYPEAPKMLYDMYQWFQTFQSTASSVDKLNENVAKKSKKLEEQELELKALRSLKDESQAAQMDAFELRFAKEELETKIKILQSDLQKATQALEASKLQFETEKTAKEADLKASCMSALKSLVDLGAVPSEGALEYGKVLLSRLSDKGPLETTFTVFEEVVKDIFRDVKARGLLSSGKVQELEENLRKVSLDLVRAQHAGESASSDNTRLRDKVADLEKALKEAKDALQTTERRVMPLQDVLNENHVALRDAMTTVNELKKQIETSKESAEQQIRELIQEKAAVGQLLTASNEQSKALHDRMSVLSTQAAVALQEVQAQRSRADGLQGEFDAERRMHSNRLAEVDGQYKALEAQIAHKEIELLTLKVQHEALEAQYQQQDSKLQGLKLIESSARDGENLNGQLLLFLRDVWSRLHDIQQMRSSGFASANPAPTDIMNLKLAITSMIQEVRTQLESSEGKHVELQDEKRVLAEQLGVERDLRIAADLLVQKHFTTITSNEAQLKALLHDHETIKSQADSQIQDLIAERAKQEHCNGSLAAQVTLLSESEYRQREEILQLQLKLSKATAQINTVESRLDITKRDSVLEIASLKIELENAKKTDEMRLQEIKANSAEKRAGDDMLSQTVEEAEKLRLELAAARSEIVSISAQSVSRMQELDEREKALTVQLVEHKGALLEESKIRAKEHIRQQELQRRLDQYLAEEERLHEALTKERKLVSDLQIELETAKRAQLVDPNSPERKEQIEQVKRHYRQELSAKDNEIKKLQRKLRDAIDRQARLSEQISQLKNHPTLFQSQTNYSLSSPSAPDAASNKSTEDPESSLTALNSLSSPRGSAASEEGGSSRKPSAEWQNKDNGLLLVQSPALTNKPVSLSDLAGSSSSPESSQSSLSESQIIKPQEKEISREVPLETAAHLSIPSINMDTQEEEQSQGWLRRSTRRSRSVSGGPAMMDNMPVHGAEKPTSGAKRARRS